MDSTARTQARRTLDGDPHEQARLLVDRARKGEILDRKDWDPCSTPLDVVRLWAYLGDEAARRVVGPLKCSQCLGSGGNVVECSHCDGSGRLGGTTLDVWTAGLLPLLEPLPPRVHEVACNGESPWGGCKGGVLPKGSSGLSALPRRCGMCKGTGTRTIKTSAAQWLSVVGCLAVARAVADSRWPGWWVENGGLGAASLVREALDACDAWVKEPTEANRQACDSGRQTYSTGAWWIETSGMPVTEDKHRAACVAKALTSATQLFKADARKVFADALLSATQRGVEA